MGGMKFPKFSLRKLALAATAAGVLGTQAAATWSIVVVDSATGEVCVAGATCIESFHVKQAIAIIVVGKGAGAGQALASRANNAIIWRRLKDDNTPQEILDRLEQIPNHHTRQYGVATFHDPAVTFSGSSNGPAHPGVVGRQGTMRYAIQGNVLAGDAVVFEAEQTLLTTTGDLSQRVMAAMETARSFGGDGRCSCATAPTACGSPPPSFTKSAHGAFIVMARIGDKDKDCGSAGGCAGGTYYLDRRFTGSAADIDPVIGLQTRYDNWRLAHIGRVDHIRTEVFSSSQRVAADGASAIDVTVQLRDIDGTALTTGGQTLHVRGIGGPQAASVESIVDNGDGTHSFRLRAGTSPGHASYRVVVEDGQLFTLHPPLEIDVDPLTRLHVGFDEVSASVGADVPLVTNAGAAEAGRPYVVLASASGTVPGTPFNGQVLPLNMDRLLHFTMTRPGSLLFPGSAGQLDADGRSEAVMQLTPSILTQFIGSRFDFASVLFGNPDSISDPVGFDILP